MPKQLILIIIILIINIKSWSFLDAIADTAKDTAKGAAVAGSVAALLEETGVAAKQAKNLMELKKQVDTMNQQIYQIKGINDETKRLLKGPDYNDLDELSNNIDKTTQYIKTVKALLTTVGVMSPETSSALTGVTMVSQLDKIVSAQNSEEIERQKQKADLQRRRVNLYTGMAKRLQVQSQFVKDAGISGFASNLATSFYDKSFELMMLLLPVIFLGKVVFSNLFGSAEDHFDNLKTLVMYFFFMYGFKIILPHLIDLPYLIHTIYDKNITAQFDSSSLFAKYVEAEKSSAWSFDYLTVIDSIISAIEFLVQILISALFVLLALLAPIIIMLSVMLNLGVGVKLLFGIMFIMGTWNVAIIACDIMVKEMLINSPAGLNTWIMPLIGAGLKILAGATNILLVLKSQAASGMMKSLKMGMGSLGGGNSKFSSAMAQGSKGSASSAVNSYNGSTGLDAKLERMPPPQAANTFAGLARAENRIRQNEVHRSDMMKARENLGLDPKQKNSQKGSNSQNPIFNSSQKTNNSNSLESSSSDSYNLDSKNSSSERSKLDSKTNSGQKSQNQSSNTNTVLSGDSKKLSEYSGSEAASWSKNKDNLKNMSTGDLKNAMNDFSAKKDAPVEFNQENQPYTGAYKSAISDRVDFEKSYYNTRNELKNRQALGDSEADEALQSGHIEKKRGRK